MRFFFVIVRTDRGYCPASAGLRASPAPPGRGAVRRTLYLAALSAVRHAGSLRRFYQGLRQRGKPGKVALVALMRKTLLQLNAAARRGTPWIEQPATAA